MTSAHDHEPGVCISLSGDEYAESLQTFYKQDRHCEQVSDFVVENVLPAFEEGANLACLDVGAGQGTIATLLSPHFGSILAVDSNPAYYLVGDDGALHLPSGPCSSIEVVVADFLEADLRQRRFDVVLCSHVLYNMPDNILQRMIAKMVAAMKPGGFLVVVEAAPRGLTFEFNIGLNPCMTTSRTIVQALEQQGLMCQVTPATDPVRLDSTQEVETVLRFIAVENCGGLERPEESRVDAAVAQWLPRVARDPDTGAYLLQEEQDFILCRWTSAAGTNPFVALGELQELLEGAGLPAAEITRFELVWLRQRSVVGRESIRRMVGRAASLGPEVLREVVAAVIEGGSGS